MGVSYDQLKTQIPEAIRACELAVQLLPADLTLQYQLARAMELARSLQEGKLCRIDWLSCVTPQRSIMRARYSCTIRNADSIASDEAVKLFQKGAALGDPDAMMSLADQISNNQANGDVISLYQRAAKLGHPGARLALEALARERTPPPLIFRFPF